MEQWSYRDMIDLYLDGELPADHRAALFSTLASSDELQAEFHQALTLRIAALQEAQQLVPSPAVTANILAAAAPPQRGVIRGGKQLWRSVVGRMTTIVTTAAAISFVAGRLTAPTPTMIPTNGTTQQSSKLPGIQQLHQLTTIQQPPLPTSTAKPRPHTFAVAPVLEPRGVSIQSGDTVQKEETVKIEHAPLAHSEPALIPRQQLPIEPVAKQTATALAASPSPRWEIVWPDATASEIILSVRRTHTILLQQQRLVQPISSTLLANTIASLEYRQQNVGVFVQAGSEQFPIYDVTAMSDGPPRYTLRQQLWWIGGGMRAYLPLGDGNELLRTLRPVAGIMLGTSAYGVLGRGELGIVWEPFPSVGVQFLLEGMVHSHSAGTTWEHAEKLSGSIGLAFRF